MPDAPPSLDLAKSELIWEPSIIIPGKKNPYPKNERSKKTAMITGNKPAVQSNHHGCIKMRC